MLMFADDIESERARVRCVVEAYREAWRSFDPPISDDAFPGLNDCLYVIEFRAPGCDADELRHGFTVAMRELEMRAFGLGSSQRIFQMSYRSRTKDGDILVRALALVHPDQIDQFEQAAETVSQRRSGLSISKCDIDHGDPDAHWRWLAQGLPRRENRTFAVSRRNAVHI